MPSAPLPTNEPQRLATLHDYAVLDTPPEAAFADIVRVATLLCDAPVGFVSLVDRDRQWFKAARGSDAKETPRAISFCAHAILRPQEVMVVEDTTRDPRLADNPDVVGGPRYRFYAGAPLVAPDGVALGTLCLLDTVPRDLGPGQREALQALARVVVRELELRRAAIRLAALLPPDAGAGTRAVAASTGGAKWGGAPGPKETEVVLRRLEAGPAYAIAEKDFESKVADVVRRIRRVTAATGEPHDRP